jgi:hypothetical protein
VASRAFLADTVSLIDLFRLAYGATSWDEELRLELTPATGINAMGEADELLFQ